MRGEVSVLRCSKWCAVCIIFTEDSSLCSAPRHLSQWRANNEDRKERGFNRKGIGASLDKSKEMMLLGQYKYQCQGEVMNPSRAIVCFILHNSPSPDKNRYYRMIMFVTGYHTALTSEAPRVKILCFDIHLSACFYSSNSNQTIRVSQLRLSDTLCSLKPNYSMDHSCTNFSNCCCCQADH